LITARQGKNKMRNITAEELSCLIIYCREKDDEALARAYEREYEELQREMNRD
jgi:hypothetical protein